MLHAYEAVIENGALRWLDTVPNLEQQTVQVIILPKQSAIREPITNQITQANATQSHQRVLGALAGKAQFPDDINKYDDEVARLFGVD